LVIRAADSVFLTVPDDSIGTVANTLRFDVANAHSKNARALLRRVPDRHTCAGPWPRGIRGGFHPLDFVRRHLGGHRANRRVLRDTRQRANPPASLEAIEAAA
jgi:hypothetical protein